MIHQLIYNVLLVLCSGYALSRGGGPERLAAALMLVSSAASRAAVSTSGPFSHLELGLLAIDLSAYLASFLLMLLANRFWTIWMSAAFGVELLAHLLAIPDSRSLNLTYAILERVWGYPLAMLPAIGAWRHRQRLKRHGVDRSWSDFSSRSRGERSRNSQSD